MKQIIYHKDNGGRTFLYEVCEWCSKKNLPGLLKSLLDWMEEKVADFSLDQFLLENDEEGRLFLNALVISRPTYHETTACIVEILQWLLTKNVDLTEKIIYNKSHRGPTILHDFCMLARKKEIAALLKTLLNWMIANISDFKLKEFLMRRDNDGRICLGLIVFEDVHNEATSCLIEILDWLWLTDPDIVKQIPFHTSNSGQTILHGFCSWGRKKDLPNLVKTLLDWMVKNIPDFKLNEFLLQKDNDGILFLSGVVFRDYHNEATASIIEILSWILTINLDLVTQIIYSKNELGRTVLHNFFMWAARKKDLLVLLKSLLFWMEKNIPNFELNEFLLRTDNEGKYFLGLIVFQAYLNDAYSSIVEILDWLLKTSSELMKQILYNVDYLGRTIFHDFCRWSKKKDLLGILKSLIGWIEVNDSNFKLNEFLLKKDHEGSFFLTQITVYDYLNEGLSSIIEILDWFLVTFPDVVKKILFSKNIFNKSFLSDLSKFSNTKDLPNLFKKLSEWLKRNNFDIREIVSVEELNENEVLRATFEINLP